MTTNMNVTTAAVKPVIALGSTLRFENMQDAVKVVAVRPERGFGFVEFKLPNGIETRAFFHVNQIANALAHHGVPQTADRIVGAKIQLQPQGWVVVGARLIHRPSNIGRDARH